MHEKNTDHYNCSLFRKYTRLAADITIVTILPPVCVFRRFRPLFSYFNFRHFAKPRVRTTDLSSFVAPCEAVLLRTRGHHKAATIKWYRPIQFLWLTVFIFIVINWPMQRRPSPDNHNAPPHLFSAPVCPSPFLTGLGPAVLPPEKFWK